MGVRRLRVVLRRAGHAEGPGLPPALVNRARRRPPALVLVAATAGLLLFALPLLGLIQRADWANLLDHLRSPAATDAMRLSLTTSTMATVVAIVLGLPLAWVLARTDIPGRAAIRALVLLPMVLPPVVGGVALLSAFSRRSPIGGWLYDAFGIQLTFSRAGVVLAEAFVAMPFFVITVEAALRATDQRYEQVAAGLGASPNQVFRRVTLPLIAPAVIAGAILSWARALGEFGATITFAGNIQGRTRTLPLAVYLQLESDPQGAIALSLVLLLISFAVLIGLRDRWLGAAR
ncbi:ABC transporter permease [Aquihabitans sp. McL0605]|uniref:ABC transporter permease n=1 Tax=Aquihabitans sp. McL0605 TaxID=3415671 RepID=UPI003CF00626